VLEQGLDVALHIGKLADSGLVARQLGSVRFLVVASPDYLRAHPAPLQPDHLLQHRAIVYGRADEAPSNRWEFVLGKERRSVAVQVALMVRDGTGAVDAAVLGIGVARPYSVAVATQLAEGRLVPSLADWSSPPQPVQPVYSRGRHPSAEVRVFIDYVAATLRAALRESAHGAAAEGRDLGKLRQGLAPMGGLVRGGPFLPSALKQP
jgi:DNA-binding transcriptional LysR family regulator